MRSFGKVLETVAVIFLLPVIIPWALFELYWEARKIRGLVDSTACQECGRILGLEAKRLADTEWSDEVFALGVRLEQTVHAICPYCAIRYRFLERENELEVEEPEPDTRIKIDITASGSPSEAE